MQVGIFEARPLLSVGPNENSSFHGGVCISFNGSGTPQAPSKDQLLFYDVSFIARWVAGNV